MISCILVETVMSKLQTPTSLLFSDLDNIDMPSNQMPPSPQIAPIGNIHTALVPGKAATGLQEKGRYVSSLLIELIDNIINV